MKFPYGRQRVALLALVPLLALVTACSGGGHHAGKAANNVPATTTAAPQAQWQSAVAVADAYNACMAKHGAPTLAPGAGKPSTATLNKIRAAAKACNKKPHR